MTLVPYLWMISSLHYCPFVRLGLTLLPENITVKSIGIKNIYPEIFLNSSAWLSNYRISKASMLILHKRRFSMKYIGKDTFSAVTLV